MSLELCFFFLVHETWVSKKPVFVDWNQPFLKSACFTPLCWMKYPVKTLINEDVRVTQTQQKIQQNQRCRLSYSRCNKYKANWKDSLLFLGLWKALGWGCETDPLPMVFQELEFLDQNMGTSFGDSVESTLRFTYIHVFQGKIEEKFCRFGGIHFAWFFSDWKKTQVFFPWFLLTPPKGLVIVMLKTILFLSCRFQRTRSQVSQSSSRPSADFPCFNTTFFGFFLDQGMKGKDSDEIHHSEASWGWWILFHCCWDWISHDGCYIFCYKFWGWGVDWFEAPRPSFNRPEHVTSKLALGILLLVWFFKRFLLSIEVLK